MKKLILFFSVILTIALSFCVTSFAKSDISEKDVTDYSGLVSDYAKDYISENNKILYEKTGAKIIFVITDQTSSQSITDHAKQLYVENGISTLGRKNSIFIVVDSEKKEYAFVKGKNLKYALSESEVYKFFVDSFEPYFSKGSYDSALVSVYNAFGRWYESNYNDLSLSLDDNYSNYMYGTRQKDERPKSESFWLWVGAGVSLIILLISLSIKRQMTLKKRRYERRKLKEKHRKDIDKMVKS